MYYAPSVRAAYGGEVDNSAEDKKGEETWETQIQP
jgi:hypothetical protein